MARFNSGYRTTGVATSLLPMASIYSPASTRPQIVEVGIFNTTATAVNVAMCRLTTAGTSSSVSSIYGSDDSQTAGATPRNTHSSTGPTITAGNIRQAALGAAIGSGVIWTFGPGELVIPTGVANGIGIYTPNGTGQICDVYWCWLE
jgi:hypothetical protein